MRTAIVIFVIVVCQAVSDFAKRFDVKLTILEYPEAIIWLNIFLFLALCSCVMIDLCELIKKIK